MEKPFTMAAVEQHLSEMPLLTDLSMLTQGQTSSLLTLLYEPGFAALYGLLMAERQALLLRLAETPLEVSAGYAAVLQGQIKGIASIGTTLLEIAELFNKD
jgi:hypothetical protein